MFTTALRRRLLLTGNGGGGGGGGVDFNDTANTTSLTIDPDEEVYHERDDGIDSDREYGPDPMDSDHDSMDREDRYSRPKAPVIKRPRTMRQASESSEAEEASECEEEEEETTTSAKKRIKKRNKKPRPSSKHNADDNQDDGILVPDEDQTKAADPIKEPCAFRALDWDAVEHREEATDHPDYCYLCDVALTEQQLQNDMYYTMLRALEANCISDIDPLLFAEKIQKFYNSFLRKKTVWVKRDPVTDLPLRDANKEHIKYNPDVPWRRKNIYMHYYKHAPTPHFMVEHTLRVINELMYTLADNGLFEKDPTDPDSKPEVNTHKTQLYLRLVKERKSLIPQVEKYRSSATKK